MNSATFGPAATCKTKKNLFRDILEKIINNFTTMLYIDEARTKCDWQTKKHEFNFSYMNFQR